MNQPSNILRSRKFGDNWKLSMNRSYDWVIDYANNLNPSFVIDAGCGRNVYKNKIQNLVGFDPGNYQDADFITSILEANFDPESADIVLALGSVQFISLKYIRKNLEKILSWVKPGGHLIMRATLKDQEILKNLRRNNPIKMIPWSIEFLEEMTRELNLEIVVDPILVQAEYNSVRAKRKNVSMQKMYWVWRKTNV